MKAYRGGKTRRREHGQPDLPVCDAPLEQCEIASMHGKAVPILDKYLKTAERGTNRKALARHRQRLEVWQYWTSGRSPSWIAQKMRIYLDTVNKHIRFWRDRLEEGLAAIPVIAGAELILHYQNIYHEAIEAWHRSKEPEQRSSVRTVNRTFTGPDGSESTEETANQLQQVQQVGDPRLLERAQVALDRIAILQGMVRAGGLGRPGEQPQEATGQPIQRVQIYLPHNGRDDLDGQIIESTAVPADSQPHPLNYSQSHMAQRHGT